MTMIDGEKLVELLAEVFVGEEGPRQAIEFAREVVANESRRKISWGEWFMGIASTIARKSKDTTQVGAVAIDPVTRFLKSAGFNGIPKGVEDRPERYERPIKYEFVSHAEENLVASAARTVLEGTTVYVTHQPCARCSRLLVQAGVKAVVYGPGKTSMPPSEFATGKTIFTEAGICCKPVDAED